MNCWLDKKIRGIQKPKVSSSWKVQRERKKWEGEVEGGKKKEESKKEKKGWNQF